MPPLAVTPNENQYHPLKLLTEPELRAILSISRSSVHRLARAGVLPRGIRIGKRGIRWRLRDIERWLETREEK